MKNALKLLVAGLLALPLFCATCAAQTVYMVDPDFDAGDHFVQYTWAPNTIFDAYVQEDGKVVAVGNFHFMGSNLQGIGRVFSNGSADYSFNPFNAWFHGVYMAIPMDITYMPDSNCYLLTEYAGGITRVSDTLWSIHDNRWHFIYGSVDLFGHNKFRHTHVLPDGKILALGNYNIDSSHVTLDRRLMIRVFPNGSIDTTFTPVRSIHGYSNEYLLDIIPLHDGKWLISGRFEGINGFPTVNIARLNADFSVDTTFVSPLDTLVTYHAASCQILLVDSSGHCLINNAIDGLVFPPQVTPVDSLQVFRLLTDGTIDTSFHFKYLYSDVWDYRGAPVSALNTENGYIIAGVFSSYNGIPRADMLEVDFNGNLLPTFANMHPDNNPNSAYPNYKEIDKIIRLPNGDLYVVGNFTKFGGYDRRDIVRLKKSAVGLQEQQQIPKLQVWPNPASEKLVVQLPENATQAGNVKLYDITGRAVKAPVQWKGQNRAVIDVRGLSNGIYVVTLSNNGRVVGREKVVVER